MNLLELEELRVSYRTARGLVHAVDGVDLALEAGTTLGLVGESGSGKSTLAKAVVGIAPITAGQVRLDGVDIAGLRGKKARGVHKRIQIVFQDPYSSLNPRLTVGRTLEEPMSLHLRVSRAERRREVGRLLEQVGLEASDARLYPFQFSGGQRQRIAIARALAVRPELVVADEITSALDVSVQARMLNLIRELQANTGVSFLFISHNLAVVRYLAPRIAVMHLGKVVEVGPAQEMFTAPRHPYTRVLIDSVPRLHQRDRARTRAVGDLPDPHDPPQGCRFRTRCPVGPLTRPEREICLTEDPHAGAENRPHDVACHFGLEPAVSDD